MALPLLVCPFMKIDDSWSFFEIIIEETMVIEFLKITRTQ
jgi:hypothetical protein